MLLQKQKTFADEKAMKSMKVMFAEINTMEKTY